MVNGAVLVQSGEPLKVVMAKYTPSARNQVQPFLDGYSVVLDEIVAMERGKDAMGFTPICDAFPAGSAQPAWAAIVRSGAIHISSDGKGQVRIFLPIPESSGNVDAKKAYMSSYSLLRHPLSWLAANNNTADLSIEVFCFNNDYASLCLNLSMQSYIFSASKFPSSFPKPLNVRELEKVLVRAANIKGAKLGDGALDLAANEGDPMSIAGAPISLSDLSVAYRACFHAGANEPYVSLDRNSMPTKVTVNFGGYLEDTRIGSVLLESDKRFKSFSTGLSPDGIADIAASVKTVAPAFSSKDERKLLSREVQSHELEHKWQHTRFWFYPNSISVETDLSGKIAAITSPRFTADAERSAEEIRQLGLAKEYAKKLLAPETKAAIDQLNADYNKLSKVFPELKELDAVGQIMGLFVWAKHSPGAYEVDLDELLAVELPAFDTPREKNQLISTSLLVKAGKGDGQPSKIKRYSFTSNLNQRLGDLHFTDGEYAILTSATNTRWSNQDVTKSMSELLNSERLVENFAEVMTERLLTSSTEKDDEAQLDRLNEELKNRSRAIDELDAQMKTLKQNKRISEYNLLVPSYNQAVQMYRQLVDSYSEKVKAYNARPYVAGRVEHIGGGISVSPNEFKVTTVNSSHEIESVSKAFNQRQQTEGWIVSGPRTALTESTQTSRTPTATTWTHYDAQSGMRASSVSHSGLARDRILTAGQNGLTSICFKPDGSQECHIVTKSDSSNGTTTYTFSRVAGTRYLRPSPVTEK
jgi:hypothetical protein